MRIPNGAYAVLVVGVFAGTIGVAALGGAWQTTGRTGDGTGAGGGGGGAREVVVDGGSTTQIKGWMMIGEVADAWGIPLQELLDGVGLPADTPASTPLKELESDTFSVAALRAWIDERGDGTGSDGP